MMPVTSASFSVNWTSGICAVHSSYAGGAILSFLWFSCVIKSKLHYPKPNGCTRSWRSLQGTVDYHCAAPIFCVSSFFVLCVLPLITCSLFHWLYHKTSFPDYSSSAGDVTACCPRTHPQRKRACCQLGHCRQRSSVVASDGQLAATHFPVPTPHSNCSSKGAGLPSLPDCFSSNA